MKTVRDYFSIIGSDEKKEALLIEAATEHPKLLEAYVRAGNYFYEDNEKTFVEKAPTEILEIFAKNRNTTVGDDNDEAFRERLSPEALNIYDGETELTDEEAEALNLPEDFLNEEEIAALQEIVGSEEEDDDDDDDDDDN